MKSFITPGQRRLSYQNRLRLLLLPYLVGILLLVLLPAGLSFGLAFFHFDALSPPAWAGLLNFHLAFSDALFLLSLQNSVVLVLLPVPLRLLVAFSLALLLRRPGPLVTWFRAAVFLPSVIPTAALALAWLWIFNPVYGPLNLLLQAVGLAPPAWFADPLWARPALMLVSLWSIGEGFLVCLAALADMPTGLADAAAVDGASPARFVWHVTLPLMAPILLLLSLRDAILALQDSFTATLLTTGGGPYFATYNLPLFIYEQGFDRFAFGTASAALWVLYALSGLIVLLLAIIARQWQVGVTDEPFLL